MIEPPSGFLALDKPAGVSSARALNAVKRALPRKTKVGHAGTLDPFATGVLVVLVGRATKQCERVMGLAKGYDATIKLGSTTETLDPESAERAVWHPRDTGGPPPEDFVRRTLAGMVGDLRQKPPAFSAIKVGGRRAYDLARGGADVQLPARTVRLDAADVASYEWPFLRLQIRCGRGFYVRSFARDLAVKLEVVGGYLTALRRTFVGPFHERDAVRPEDVSPASLRPAEWLDDRLGESPGADL